jgi:hypothetical protein
MMMMMMMIVINTKHKSLTSIFDQRHVRRNVYSTFAIEWVTMDDEGMNNQSARQNAASESHGSASPP